MSLPIDRFEIAQDALQIAPGTKAPATCPLLIFLIEDALRGRTTARPPLVNSHDFDSQPSCLGSGDKHPWRTLEIGKGLA